jgi:hypothetical protein
MFHTKTNDYKIATALHILRTDGPCSVDYLRERVGGRWRGMMEQLQACEDVCIYWHQRRRWVKYCSKTDAIAKITGPGEKP